jgi:lipoprotein-anchoring transpeptidase ErfK/SrfK
VRYIPAAVAIRLRYAWDRLVIFLGYTRFGKAVLVALAALAVFTGYAALQPSPPARPPFAVHTFKVHPRALAVANTSTSITSTLPTPPTTTSPPPLDPSGQVVVPDQTLLATLKRATPYYASPSPAAPAQGTVPLTWHGASSTLPIINQVGSYDEVRLAQRPNGSTGWIAAADTTLSQTPYFIVIDLFTTKLTVYDNGAQVGQFPAGVGTSADPTPTGNYFIAFDAQPASAGYGPVVMATSAHSDVIQDWSDSGDAMIAVHGPIGSDAAIGARGAHITHGCIRLHITDQRVVAQAPAGTPVVIIA